MEKSVNKRIFGIIISVMPKENLIRYKKKLGRNVDIADLRNLEKK